MMSDLVRRQIAFIPVREHSIELLEAVNSAGLTPKNMDIGPVFKALERSCAAGVNIDGSLVDTRSKKDRTSPLVLQALPGQEGNVSTEYGSYITTKNNPMQHSRLKQTRLVHTGRSDMITLPWRPESMSRSLLHETVHSVDGHFNKVRLRPKARFDSETQTALVHTERRAYALEAATLALSGVEIPKLAEEVMSRFRSKDIDPEAISDMCLEVPFNLGLADEKTISTASCLESFLMTMLFSGFNGRITKKEVESYRLLGLIS